MSWNQARGDWKQFRGKVKMEWGKLADVELNQIAGKGYILFGKIHIEIRGLPRLYRKPG